jgi:hypothetical protein
MMEAVDTSGVILSQVLEIKDVPRMIVEENFILIVSKIFQYKR